MKLYTTEMDACPVGCGHALVFLLSTKRDSLFLSCGSCGAVFDKDRFLTDEPAIYYSKHFSKGELTIPPLETIRAKWLQAVLEQDEEHSEYELKCLRWHLGNRVDC